LLLWHKFDLVSRFILKKWKKLIISIKLSCSNGCCKDACCDFETEVTSLIQTNTTVSNIKSSLAVENIVFNVIIMVLVLLLAVCVWWLMRDQKRQWSKLKTRLTKSFSRFTMVSYVNNNDEVNIS
jgi:hypothetical protein